MYTVKYRSFYIHGYLDKDSVTIQHCTNYIFNQQHRNLEAAKRWIRHFDNKVNKGKIERYQIMQGKVYPSVVDLVQGCSVLLQGDGHNVENATQAELAEYFVIY